jgi:hypothetical protein
MTDSLFSQINKFIPENLGSWSLVLWDICCSLRVVIGDL